MLSAFPAGANEPGWRTSWDAALYGYASHLALRGDSVLNPGNQVARIAQRSDTAELRMNAKAENDVLRYTARGIASVRELRNGDGAQTARDAYLSQWQLRVLATDDLNVAVGRDVLNWGAAQFRSPSSPYYFDSGRSDPMRELTGMDMLKLSWTPDRQRSVQLVRVVRAGDEQAQSEIWRNSWLAKYDQRDDEWAYGLAAASAPHQAVFYGAHGQWMLGEAAMVYGEWSSSTQREALVSPAQPALSFTVLTATPRRNSLLLGTSYTFDSGHTLNAEYLHDGHGYTADQAFAYFARAASSPSLAGMALGNAPRLLGRDYLHLVWQSNLMERDGYWRMMYTNDLTDHGGSLGAYTEYVLNTHISAFAVALYNTGNARQEAAALLTRSVTLGVKIALP
jgi:hypothetical protein